MPPMHWRSPNLQTGMVLASPVHQERFSRETESPIGRQIGPNQAS